MAVIGDCGKSSFEGGLLEASLVEAVSRQTGRRESDSECLQQLLLREDAMKEFVIRFKIVTGATTYVHVLDQVLSSTPDTYKLIPTPQHSISEKGNRATESEGGMSTDVTTAPKGMP